MRNSILSFLIFTLFLLSGIIYLQLKPETDSTPLVDKKLTATNWDSSVGNQFVSTPLVAETTTNSSITTYPNTTTTVAGPMVDFTAVAAHTTPCVVHIKTTSNNNNSSLGEMWGGSNGSGGSSGSGVIISKDGYIVTNYHVIEGAGAIEVILNNRRNLDAQVIGTDPSTDLAVIRVSDSNLQSIDFGDSDKLQVGEWVMAVGNPFNLASTVTTGIVSAKARNINILEDNLAIESFIQTDAAVNPGNSGGALVNLSGQLIGVNTAIATPTGYYAGYAFAVPVNIVRKVVTDIIEFGEVKRGFLGVSIRGIDGKLAKRYKLDEVEGVYVANVNINSAAANADIKEGDIILEVEGVKVNSAPELQERISLHRPGAHVSLLIKRDNKNILKDVLLKGSY
ncbi:MAG: trypsin-like peptidase domain-containing protein [Chitinophagales bacterium]